MSSVTLIYAIDMHLLRSTGQYYIVCICKNSFNIRDLEILFKNVCRYRLINTQMYLNII